MNKLSQTIPYQVDTAFSPFRAEEFPAALAFLEEAGFTGVELAVAYPRKVNASALYKQLQSHHLAATTISTGQIYGLEGLFLASPDEAVRKGAIEIVKGHIELSADLGAPIVTIGLIRGKLEEGDPAVLLDTFRSAMMPCVEYAAKYGVDLQVEPIRKDETVIINSTYDGLDFLHALGDPAHVGILYDVFHSNLEDGDMFAAIAAAAGRIKNVHLADSHRGLPGYGEIDFKAIYKAIQATGYTGPYALETLAIPSPEFVNAHCFESVQKIMQ
ncbi:sugar phosphate isomerase/epimerase [Christensenellaceae bacterium OttesenSCG-928-L17]|nr:sugar phosphate isomerase/epimerase [Christensenellaceae bacterium OttesenSCG-928-L17]